LFPDPADFVFDFDALVFALVKAAPPEMIPSWHGRLNPFAATPAGWWVRSSSSPWRSVQQSL